MSNDPENFIHNQLHIYCEIAMNGVSVVNSVVTSVIEAAWH